MALEGLLEDLHKDIIKIKELQQLCNFDIMMEMKPSNNLSGALSIFENFRLKLLSDIKNSIDSIPVVKCRHRKVD
jgi:hypothetical protein